MITITDDFINKRMLAFFGEINDEQPDIIIEKLIKFYDKIILLRGLVCEKNVVLCYVNMWVYIGVKDLKTIKIDTRIYNRKRYELNG